MLNANLARWIILVGALTSITGCTFHPQGEQQERDAALATGKPYEKPVEARLIPDLSAEATPEQIVEHALLANADLERRYWEWRAAIEQIPQDGAQSTNLNLSGGTSITHGRASWGSSTVSLSNDPMSDIKWPSKLDAAAKQSLESARAAGQRFLKAKYELRYKVLSAYYDYALEADLIRLEQRNQQLLQLTAATTASRNRAGAAGMPDVLKADDEVEISGNDIASMRAQLTVEKAAINALLSRPATEPLATPTELPRSRPLAYDDAEVVDLAAKRNPELLALADDIRGRKDGVRLAQLQYIPDFNLSAGTDLMGITQSVLGQATIPILRYEAINAAIAQARANLRASEAMGRQSGSDLGSQVISNITLLRDADRQLDLIEHSIFPRLQQVVAIRRSAYENGQSTLLDLLDDQRSLLAIERLMANLTISREEHLLELETITTVNLSVRDQKDAIAGVR